MRFISNVLFFFAVVTTLISIVLFDLSMRYLKNGDKLKSKDRSRLGFKFLIWSGLFYLVSYITGILVR